MCAGADDELCEACRLEMWVIPSEVVCERGLERVWVILSASCKGEDNCNVKFDDPKGGRYARMRWVQHTHTRFLLKTQSVSLLEFNVTTRTGHRDDAQQGIRLVMIFLPQVHDDACKIKAGRAEWVTEAVVDCNSHTPGSSVVMRLA